MGKPFGTMFPIVDLNVRSRNIRVSTGLPGIPNLARNRIRAFRLALDKMLWEEQNPRGEEKAKVKSPPSPGLLP